MTSDQFCLKWNNFQSNIVCALGNLKLDEDFVDVTLSCEGRSIKAHKVILSACSAYFKHVFRENPCQHPVVILKDVQYVDIESLVKYMYQGQVYIAQDQLGRFLKTAEALQIKGLAEHPNISSKMDYTPIAKMDYTPILPKMDYAPLVTNYSPVQSDPLERPESKLTTMLPQMSIPNMSHSTFSHISTPCSTPLHLPSLSSSPSPTFSSPSPCSLPSPIKHSVSPLKVPTPPTPSLSSLHMKRSSFTSLAHYLSGSPTDASTSPPLDCLAKRRKTTPKRYDTPSYLYSSSPAHSTEGQGSEKDLDVTEESDMEGTKSPELGHSGPGSAASAKSPHSLGSLPYGGNSSGSSDYGQDSDKTKVETDDAISEDGGGLIIEEGTRAGLDMEDKEYGETLDLSKRKGDEYRPAHSHRAVAAALQTSLVQTNGPHLVQTSGTLPSQLVQTSGTVPGQLVQTSGTIPGQLVQTSGTVPGHLVQTSLPLIATHITSTRVLEAALTAPERDRNGEKGDQTAHQKKNCSFGQCPHCGKDYTNLSSLKYHVRLVHSEASNRLCCYLCPTSFINRPSFKEHMLRKHGVKNQ